METLDRIPPQSIDIEMSVLASFLTDRKAWLTYSPLITPDYFYNTIHKKIFSKMLSTGCTDLKIIAEYFPEYSATVCEIAENFCGNVYLDQQIEILKDRYERRRLIEISQSAAERAFSEFDMKSSEIIDETISQINSNYVPSGRPQLMNEIAPAIIAQFENQKDGIGIGYQTGLVDVDKVLGGFCKKELAIIAARPSMGKTSFALHIARYNAIQLKIPVLFFSLEMSKESIVGRAIFAEANANYEKALRGNNEDVAAVKFKYEADLSTVPLFIDDTPGTTINHLQAKIENYVLNHGIQMVVIDRLEYIKPIHRGRSGHEEISEISKGLVYCSKKFDIPILLIVQLNRCTEHREEKIPDLSDLRGSGSLEEDAVKVLMIYREEYYKRDSQKKGIAEILIRKNQNGRTGYCEVSFKKETMSFFNLQKDSAEAWQDNQ